MNENTERSLRLLEERVRELVSACERIQEENRNLARQQAELLAERDALSASNERFRDRIETMVSRLRGLERPT
jgi:cell division protein ZapB